MGSHTGGPAQAQIGQTFVSLPELIAEHPKEMLGEQVAARFQNRLPYLFKVLDAHKMLSIQAHPTLAQAAEGFEREQKAGVPVGSPMAKIFSSPLLGEPAAQAHAFPMKKQ